MVRWAEPNRPPSGAWHLLGLFSSGMLLPHPIDLKRDCI
jgi:hypothetical protein